jgi:predicted NAD/FAD-dependent oxidoreductase
LTAPAPETARLLAGIGQKRSLANCTYRTCLSVALGYRMEPPHLPYCALVDPLQRHPLTWLSFESHKCEGRAPEGCTAVVAQLSAEFSAAHIASEESEIISTTAAFLERLLGAGWATPAVAKVYRWPYGRAENIGLFDAVNNPGARVLVASDGLAGPRVEYAYEVGVRTARMLQEAP